MAVRLKERDSPSLAQIAAVAELKHRLGSYAWEHGGRFIPFGNPGKARPAVEAGRLLADRFEPALASFAERHRGA